MKHLSCSVGDTVRDIFQQATHISIIDKSRDALCDIIKETKRVA